MLGNILIPSWKLSPPPRTTSENPLRHSNPRPVHGRTNELNDFGPVKCLYVIVYAFCWPTQQYYMAARGYEFYLLVPKVLSSRLFQHEKIKVVSPSDHVMFCLFHRYWWNSYIKHNFFSFGKSSWMFFKLGKSIDVKIWQLIEKVTSNCTVVTPRSHLLWRISVTPCI